MNEAARAPGATKSAAKTTPIAKIDRQHCGHFPLSLIVGVRSNPIANENANADRRRCGLSLNLETVKAILQVKVNFDEFSCEDMHKYILDLIKQIQSGEKYHHRSLTN